jgi:NADH dehydrogenase
MRISSVCLLGGSGFIGSQVAGQLSARGIAVTLPARRREHAKHLFVLPGVDVLEANVHDDAQLRRCIAGCDAVINLAGILNPERRAGFERAHVELPRRVAKLCAENGIRRLVHMSALNAGVNGPSEYLRSRARGESAVREVAQSALDVTIFRPSVVFGAGGEFLNLLADLVKLFPVIPLGSAQTKFQPVHVGDVARAIVNCLDDERTFGNTYPLCGPKSYTLRELVEFVAATLHLRRVIVELGPALSMLQASVLEYVLFWNKILTRDNVRSMQVDCVCGCAFPEVFGFHPAALEAIVPGYLQDASQRRRYRQFREQAGR